jgi:hypothetical protein
MPNWSTKVAGRNKNDYWSATQFGLATLGKGKAAVRQRIKDRTGL